MPALLFFHLLCLFLSGPIFCFHLLLFWNLLTAFLLQPEQHCILFSVPDEVMLKIFAQLSPNDMVRGAAASIVCLLFLNVISDKLTQIAAFIQLSYD